MTETRKVQKVGGSTYTVSVPKDWATDQGVSTGSEVRLRALSDGALVVRALDADAPFDAVRVPVGDPGTVERALSAAYAAGFETVILTADGQFPADGRRAVRRIARERVGVEVTEETETAITVATLLDTADLAVGRSVAQLDFLALSMHRTAIAALAGDDSADGVADRVDGVHRRVALLTRHLARALVDVEETDRLGVGRSALFEHYCAARELERVAEHAVALADLADRLDAPLEGESADIVRSVADDARAVVEDATAVLLGGAPSRLAHDALDRRGEVERDVEAADRALLERESRDAFLAARALQHLARTADAGGTIAETALRATVRAGDDRRWTARRPPHSAE